MYHLKLKQSDKLSLTAAALLNLNLGCEPPRSAAPPQIAQTPSAHLPAPLIPPNPEKPDTTPKEIGPEKKPEPEKTESDANSDTDITEGQKQEVVDNAEDKVQAKAQQTIEALEAKLKDLEKRNANTNTQHNQEQEETKQLLVSFKEILKDSDKRKLTINQKIRFNTIFKLGNLCNSKKDIEAKILAIELEIQENEKIIDDIASSKQKNKFKAQKLKKIFNKLYEQEYQKKYLEKLLKKKKEKSGNKNQKLQEKLATKARKKEEIRQSYLTEPTPGELNFFKKLKKKPEGHDDDDDDDDD